VEGPRSQEVCRAGCVCLEQTAIGRLVLVVLLGAPHEHPRLNQVLSEAEVAVFEWVVVRLDPAFKEVTHGGLRGQNLATVVVEVPQGPTILALTVDKHVDGRGIQLCLADLVSAQALRLRLHRLESREHAHLFFFVIFLNLRLVPAGELGQWLATEIFHVDYVFKLGDKFVPFGAVQHQLRARTRLVSRLDQLHSFFRSHVLVQHGQDVDDELGWCPLRDTHVEQHLPRESLHLGLLVVFLSGELLEFVVLE